MAASRSSLPFPTLSEAPTAQGPSADWQSRVAAVGVQLDPARVEQLRAFVSLLLGANQVANLTAIREPEAIWDKLIFDALVLGQWVETLPTGATVADIGCGGGFPGLPLAIALPTLRYTLIDATKKKIGFVRHVIEQLGLTHVEALADRAESLAAAKTGPLRERFDLVTARAVAPLPALLELTSPFAKAPLKGAAGGRLMLVKGEHAGEELAQAQRSMQSLLLTLESRHQTPSSTVLFFSKGGPTPNRFPRGNGAPKHNPL